MHRSQLSHRHDWKQMLHSRLVKAWVIELLSLVGCFQGTQVRDDESTAALKRRPLDVDTSITETIGKEALEKIGYDDIFSLALKAEFVYFSANVEVQTIGFPAEMYQTLSPVFSRYAVLAGVATQLDSPLPGPADVAALGVLVIGLIDAGLLDGRLLKSFENVLSATGSATATGVAGTPDPAQLAKCQRACSSGRRAIDNFCRSLPPEPKNSTAPKIRTACFGLALGSVVACHGWCYNQWGE